MTTTCLSSVCPLCGREADELCLSDSAGSLCCVDCHCAATEPRPRVRRRRERPYKSPPDLGAVENSYPWLVRRTWRRLEELTGMRPCYLDRDHIGATCPVCRDGAVAVQFLDNPPRLRFSSARGEDRCTTGCRAGLIYEAIK